MSKLFKVSDIFLIPNLITILRFFLIDPMIITYKNGMQSYFLIILFVSLLSDFLDGIAARILDQKSELGKTLDPIADGITLFAFIILFNKEGLISTWFMIFYRFVFARGRESICVSVQFIHVHRCVRSAENCEVIMSRCGRIKRSKQSSTVSVQFDNFQCVMSTTESFGVTGSQHDIVEKNEHGVKCLHACARALKP